MADEQNPRFQVAIATPGEDPKFTKHPTFLDAYRVAARESRRIMRVDASRTMINGRGVTTKHKVLADKDEEELTAEWERLMSEGKRDEAKEYVKKEHDARAKELEVKVNVSVRIVGETLVSVTYSPSFASTVEISYTGPRDKGQALNAQGTMGREIMAERLRGARAKLREKQAIEAKAAAESQEVTIALDLE